MKLNLRKFGLTAKTSDYGLRITSYWLLLNIYLGVYEPMNRELIMTFS
ncbi:hypothetical protein [Solitalea canadensis]|nr:hypothetical protein [Solitalea canadensis]